MQEVSASELRRLYEVESQPVAVILERLDIPNAPALYKLLRAASIPLRMSKERSPRRLIRLVD